MTGGDIMYRMIKAMKAKYSLTNKDLAEIADIKTQSTISWKMNDRVDWHLAEARKIFNYFKAKGENISFEELFFNE